MEVYIYSVQKYRSVYIVYKVYIYMLYTLLLCIYRSECIQKRACVCVFTEKCVCMCIHTHTLLDKGMVERIFQ